MHHLVLFSGGVASFCAAKRVVEKEGKENVELLFTDTSMEDEDLYRFLQEGVDYLGAKLTWLKDGRTPWDVFRDRRFLGNSRIDTCSETLKRLPTKRYVRQWKPEELAVYVGMDWTELHRYERAQQHWLPYKLFAPMTERPFLFKHQMVQEVENLGIKAPRLYELGFSHNNCGGFCVKAGQAHFRHLLSVMPERYRFHAEQEEAMGLLLGKKVTILRKMTNGERVPYSLKELAEAEYYDTSDWGGCGCFVEAE